MSESPLSISLPGPEALDDQNSPPLGIFMAGRPTSGAGLFLGHFLSHDDACFTVDGKPSKKWTFVANPEKTDIDELRARIQRTVRAITRFHEKIGRDPKKWTDAHKKAVLEEMQNIVLDHNLTAARNQAEYWDRGATPVIRDRSRGRTQAVAPAFDLSSITLTT